MKPTHAPTATSLAPLLDDAERILATGMPPAIARAIIDLARRGADISADIAAPRRAATTDCADAVDLLTTREAADRLRVSEKQIYRLVSQGRLKRYGFGRQHKFHATDLADLLARSAPGALATRAARLAHEDRRAS